MAEPWIKMRHSLLRDPRVTRIALALKKDKLAVLGGLFTVWCLADEQTADGVLKHCTFDTVDAEIGWPGFCAALFDVRWVEQSDLGVTFPGYEQHNGETAKARAQKNARQSKWRDGVASTPASTTPSTRGEEIREEELHAFETFWSVWPAHHRKVNKAACIRRWVKADLTAKAVEIITHVTAMLETDDWTKNDGAYIPAPLVYLNQSRWEAPLPVTRRSSTLGLMPVGMK